MMLLILNARNRAAAGGDPGIPSTKSGIKAPPIQALLLAVSEHKSPSMEPLPKFAPSWLTDLPTP